MGCNRGRLGAWQSQGYNLAERRICPTCRAPVVAARDAGSLLFCERQQTIDGDLSLRDEGGVLVVHRVSPGTGRYRAHVCSFNSRKHDSNRRLLTTDEQHRRDVVNALDKADRVGARGNPKSGSMGYALQVLAREVRALQRQTTTR